VKVAVHRLRRKFRAVLRSRIAETVHDPAEVDEELRYLIRVLTM
jgi:RNA polymerase sigma-70 factor (ECF subfamily)